MSMHTLTAVAQHEHMFHRRPHRTAEYMCRCGLVITRCPHLDVYGPAPQEQHEGAQPFHCVTCHVDRRDALCKLFGGQHVLDALPECLYRMRINNWVGGEACGSF